MLKCAIAAADSHVASQQLDLNSDNRFTDPDQGEHTRKDQVLLVLAGTHRKEKTEEKAENERAPASC